MLTGDPLDTVLNLITFAGIAVLVWILICDAPKGR